MQLLVQVVGAVAAGLLVWALARSGGLRGRRAVGTVAVIAIVAAALLAPPNLRSAISHFTQQRDFNDSLSTEEKLLQPGAAIESNAGFFTWTKERISPGEDFQIVVGHIAKNPLLFQWAYFELEPRVAVEPASYGGWVVLYDVDPARYENSHYRDVEIYEPGYAIARSNVGG
jgi:hypothetical protein